MLNNRDAGPYICTEQSGHLVSKSLMGAWLQFVYVSKRTFSSKISPREFFFCLEFFILLAAAAAVAAAGGGGGGDDDGFLLACEDFQRKV